MPDKANLEIKNVNHAKAANSLSRGYYQTARASDVDEAWHIT
jgi:hypothetical protein